MAGWAVLSVAFAWIALTVHSGWVRYHEYQGARSFQRLQIPDELALAQADPTPWLTSNDRETIATGKQHLQAAAKGGFFVNNTTLPKLAWFHYLSGEADQAVQALERAAPYQQGQAKALSLYYRGAILNRLGRYIEAQSSLDRALEERPDLILAREEKGESLWQQGQKDQAVVVWTGALQRNPQLVLANNQLAGAAAAMGKNSEATAYEIQADEFTPSNPLYHWMLGLRLRNVGMNQLADKHFQRAIQLDPTLRSRLPR